MISIVMAVRNKAKLLRNTLLSLKSQDFRHQWELVVVDDGSTDNLDDLIKFFTPIFPIRYFKTYRQQSLSAAYPINCGVKQARGGYILCAQPEIIHVGPVIDVFHYILSGNDVLLYAPVLFMNEDDQKYLNSTETRKTAPQVIAKKLIDHKAANYGCNTSKSCFCGFRKSSFMQMGGMDEIIQFTDNDKSSFEIKWKHFNKQVAWTQYCEQGKDIVGLSQWKPEKRKKNISQKATDESETDSTSLEDKTTWSSGNKSEQAIRSNAGRQWGVLPTQNHFIDVPENYAQLDFLKKKFRFIIPKWPDAANYIKLLKKGEFSEPGILEWSLQHINHDSTVVDCGAAVGNHSILWASYCKKIFLIEPHPECCKLIAANLNLNSHINRAKTTIFQNVLSDKRELCKTRHNNTFGRGSYVPDETGDVTAVRLDELIDEPVHFMKMDIEGSEDRALRGADNILRKYHPILFVEAHCIQNNKMHKKVTDLLRSYGYEKGKDLQMSTVFITYPNR